MRTTNWTMRFAVLAALASMSLLTGCFKERPPVFFTGQDYLHLKRGETFVADRDMTLATESVVQKKDAQIRLLILALRKAQADLALRETVH
jgi:hypothetical protein